MVFTASSPNAIRLQTPGNPTKTQTFIAGKEVLLKKGHSVQIIKPKGMQQQIVTLVKNSNSQMTVPTLPKTGSIIQTAATLQQGGKNTIVKLVPGNSKLIQAVKTIPSSMLQVNKAGKFVLAKNNAGQLSAVGNQQVLVVSSNAGIRTIQTVSNAQAVNVAQAKTTTVNTSPVVSATTVGLQNVKIAGKPITISMPMNVVTSPKTVTLAKTTVSCLYFS